MPLQEHRRQRLPREWKNGRHAECGGRLLALFCPGHQELIRCEDCGRRWYRRDTRFRMRAVLPGETW